MKKIFSFILVALFSMSAWAWTISNAKVYYDDSSSGYESNVVIAFDKSNGFAIFAMTHIDHTKLHYWYGSWGDGAVSSMRFGKTTHTYDWYGHHDNIKNSWDIATCDDDNKNWTYVSLDYGTSIENASVMFVAASNAEGAALTKTDLTGYSALNHAQTVYKHTSTDNGNSYDAQELNSGTVTISAYKMTADGEASNSENSATINAAATISANVDAAYTGEVTLTATPASGYEFMGWFDSADATEAVSTNNPYTYNAPNATKSVYARFKATGATALDNTAEEVKTVKRIENGQLIIIKNGVKYNALGTEVK